LFWNLILVILIGAAIAWYEAPRLVQRQMWPELAAHIIFLLLVEALAIAMTLHLPVPNPTTGIQAVFNPLTRWLFH
jgi:hypothetical protein